MSDAPSQPAPLPEKGHAPTHPLRQLIITILKLAVAVVAIWLVVRSVTWNDSAVLPANGQPLNTLTFVEDTPVTVLNQTTTPAGKSLVRIRFPKTPVKVRTETATGERTFELIIEEGAVIPGTPEQLQIAREMEIDAGRLKEEKGQRIHEGLHSLAIKASGKWYLMALGWLLLGIPYVVTAVRWRDLMKPQGINMPLSKSLQLTFVGQFYSIMLPGITGGDLVKIVYAARLTGSKTKSFITIILDRVIGLVALMVIAATSAGIQLLVNEHNGKAIDYTLLNVFLMIAAMLAGLAIAATVYFSHRLRKFAGITWFIDNFSNLKDSDEGAAGETTQHQKLERLFRVTNISLFTVAVVLMGLVGALLVIATPWAQKNHPLLLIVIAALGLVALVAAAGLVLHALLVNKMMPVMRRLIGMIVRVDETLHVYRGHFGLLLWAFGISLVSQMTLPLSAWLSGTALGMTAPVTYYLAYVPLAVLAASLPISPPQGLGFLEWVLNHFFVNRGAATASQAFALTQCVRFFPIVWNLFGVYWVLTGQYSRHRAEVENESLSDKPAVT